MNEIQRCVNVQVSGPLRSAIVWLLEVQNAASAEQLALVAGIDLSRARAYLTSLAAGKIVRFQKDQATRSFRWSYWASDRPAKIRSRGRSQAVQEDRVRKNWQIRCSLQRALNEKIAKLGLSVMGLAITADVDDRQLHAFLAYGKPLPATDLLRVLHTIRIDPIAAAGLDATRT